MTFARLRSALSWLFWLPERLYQLPLERRFYVAQAILYASVCVVLLTMVLRAHGAELPPHAVAVDPYGTWTCERGYLMRARAGGFECVPEEEAAREPQFEVSDVPSAGEGFRSGGGEDLGEGYGYGEAPAAPSGAPVVIQSNQPWTVLLDEQGNPNTVIVGGSDSHHHGRSGGKGPSHDHRRRDRIPSRGTGRPGMAPR